MAECWGDGLAGLATERGFDEMDDLIGGLIDGKGAD